jgi:hypothetical protein
VRETIEAFAPGAVGEKILERALGAASLRSVPLTPIELAQFIDDHFVNAVAQALGPETGDAVKERLKVLIQLVGSLAPPAVDRYDEGTPTRKVARKPYSVALVVGQTPHLATKLKRHLDTRTAVIAVDSGEMLLRTLRLLERQSRIVIVDMHQRHTIFESARADPAALGGITALLWEAPPEQEAKLAADFPNANIFRCSLETSVEDLATITRLGPSQ